MANLHRRSLSITKNGLKSLKVLLCESTKLSMKKYALIILIILAILNLCPKDSEKTFFPIVWSIVTDLIIDPIKKIILFKERRKKQKSSVS